MSKPDENPPENPKEKKPGMMKRLKTAFNGVSRKDLKGAFMETARDLRQPKEIGIFLVSSILPGGWIGYAAYRITKYKLKHAPANDNAPAESPAEKPAKKRGKNPPSPKSP